MRFLDLIIKNHSSNVNKQSLKQIYTDKLEKLKMEACSVQEHNTMIGQNNRQLFEKLTLVENLNMYTPPT